MLCDCISCVCISGHVKYVLKSYGVKVGASDSDPVVTVPWSFVGRPSAVNLLHSPHTKDCLHLWLLGGGVCAADPTMKRAATSQTFFLRQPVQMTQGVLGIPLLPLQSAKPFCFSIKEFPQGVITQKNWEFSFKIIIFSFGTKYTELF